MYRWINASYPSNALVISGKVYVADIWRHWRTPSIYSEKERFIYLFMAHRILHLAKTTRGSRDACALRARRDYKLALGEIECERYRIYLNSHIPGFLKTGLAKTSTYSTTWQFKMIKLIQRRVYKKQSMFTWHFLSWKMVSRSLNRERSKNRKL